MAMADAGDTAGGAAGRGRTHNPPMELPSSNARDFFEEAQIREAETTEVRRKFDKFCTRVSVDGPDDKDYLTFDSFCRLLQYYECASPQYFEALFHAIDRTRDHTLTFKEFLLGVCAADPATTHILNSYTGVERAQFIFDFYDVDRSDMLEFDEFSRLNADCLQMRGEGAAEIRQQADEKARELGILTEDENGATVFAGITRDDLLRFIQQEKMRGTSRLFRLQKSILRARSSQHSRRHGSTPGGTNVGGSEWHGDRSTVTAVAGSRDNYSAGREPLSDGEDCEWHALLLDLEAQEEDMQDDEPLESGLVPPMRFTAPPYATMLPPAPPPSRVEVESSPDVGVEAREVAARVLRTLRSPTFDGLLPAGACNTVEGGMLPFTAATPKQFRSLCCAALRILEAEEMVIDHVQAPVKVFGALHGQLVDMLSHFKWHQPPVEDGDILYTTYVFLGDYCDRGPLSLEVLLVVLSMKVLHPHRVILLRGRHESRHLNYHLGLRQECERRLGNADGSRIYELLNFVFEHMSLAAVIGERLLAMGPGSLPPSLRGLDQLRRYRKPLQLLHVFQQQTASQPSDRLLAELFTPSALMPRELGAFNDASPEHITSFCSRHRLGAVILGRRLPARGFVFQEDGRIISVGSCVNYCDRPDGNDAAILCITKEEQPSNVFRVRPRVVTGRTAKLHRLLGRNPGVARSMLRWPAHTRAETPGRVGKTASGVSEGLLCVHADGSVQMQAEEQQNLPFPAFGPGRPPTRWREHCISIPPRATVGADSPRSHQARDARNASTASGTDGHSFVSSIGGPEEWSLGRRGSGDGRASGAGTPVRASGLATAGGVQRSLFGPPRRTSGSGDAAEPEGHRIQGLRTPGGSIAAAAGGSATAAGASPSGTRSAAGVSTSSMGGAHRRGLASPSSEAARFAAGIGSGGGGGASPGASGPAGVGAGGSGRDLRSTATGRGSSGGHRDVPGQQSQQSNSRGTSRTPGNPPQPHPKGSSTPGAAAGGAAGSRIPVRRPSGGDADGAGGGGRTLEQLLRASPHLAVTSLPAVPGQFLQTSWAPEYPLTTHLCKMWVDCGLTDREWGEAVHMYERDLGEQPQQRIGRPAGVGGEEPSGAAEAELENRWTLETYSMWLLKYGRKLKECQSWFEAFDLDGDGMVGVADFLQGLAATSARKLPEPSSACGVCAATIYHRLLNMHNEPLDVRELERHMASGQAGDLQHIAHRASEDFDFFSASVFPLLNRAAFRLRALSA